MATLLQLVGKIKKRLKDPEFDDEILIGYVNDAQNEVLGESPYMFLEKIDDFLDIPMGELDLPRDYQTTRTITAIKDHVGHTIDYVAPIAYFEAKTQKHPGINYKYTIFGNRLYYTVPRDNNPKPFKIRHLYLAKPRELVRDTDKPNLPDEYSEILVLGALMRAEEDRDNYDFAAIHERRYEQLVENMKLRYGPRQQAGANKARLPYGHQI